MIRPYSLFAYYQRDGRNTFVITPERGRDLMLTGIRQLSFLYPRQPAKLRCVVVVVSYQKGAPIRFDARYQVSPYAHLIAAGIPFYFEFEGPRVEAHPLDANNFFNGSYGKR